MKILLIVLVIFFLTGLTFASEIEDYLDELRYMDLQFAAVTTDMHLYLGWLPEEKDMMKVASLRAIADLNEIKNRLSSLDLSNELVNLKDMNSELIDRLQKIYNGIEKKELEEIKKEFSPFNELYSQFSEEFKKTWEKYGQEVELREDFDSINEEVKLVQEQKDKEIYLSAIKLIEDKKYGQAYKTLSGLRQKYMNSDFESCVMLKITDCMLSPNTDLEVDEKLSIFEEGVGMLSNITDKNVYSPILYEAFYKWRTATQEFYHGMSNMSEIPNKAYNEKRWKTVQIIKQHLKNNPTDIWAKAQVELLLDLPNIQRGGPFGNDNLVHWGILYSDVRPPEKGNNP